MAYNGSGVFLRLYNWVNDANAAIPITASRMDGEFDNYQTGMNTVICKDGQTTTTQRIPFAAGTSSFAGSTMSVSYAAAGDLNTGIYFPAADKVGIVANGTEQVRIESAQVAPIANNTVDLGSSSNKWKDGYYAGNLIVGGTATITGNMSFGGTVSAVGSIAVAGTSSAAASLSLAEDTDNGTNKVTITIPASLAADYILTLPADDGTNGQFLTTNGSGVTSWTTPSTPATGWVPIKTVTASNSTTVDFVNGSGGVVLDGTYKAYKVIGSSIVSVSNSVALYFRISTDGGSSYETTNAYSYAGIFRKASNTTVTGTNLNPGDQVNLTAGDTIGTTTASGANFELTLYNPAASSPQGRISWSTGFVNAGGEGSFSTGAASLTTASIDIDAIRFLMSSGNISSGTFTLYGLASAA